MATNLDHIVIGAATLAQGVAWVKEKLGVDIPYGGEHPQMGTHNHVMRLGGDVYLEVIAINPEAPAPNRPRWFSLDDPFIRARLSQEPTVLTWVVNTPHVTQLLQATPFPFGRPEPMHRGELRWLFTIPPDGHLPAAGFLPTIIEWQTQPHPSGRMADPGCRLKRLTIHHSHLEWLGNIITSIGAERLVTLQPLPSQAGPYFTAEFKTPGGDVQLSSNFR